MTTTMIGRTLQPDVSAIGPQGTTEEGEQPLPLGKIGAGFAAHLDSAIGSDAAGEFASVPARQIYDVLVARGFNRVDILDLAGTLVDLVTSDVPPVGGRE